MLGTITTSVARLSVITPSVVASFVLFIVKDPLVTFLIILYNIIIVCTNRLTSTILNYFYLMWFLDSNKFDRWVERRWRNICSQRYQTPFLRRWFAGLNKLERFSQASCLSRDWDKTASWSGGARYSALLYTAANIKTAWKRLPRANTLAYFAGALMANKSGWLPLTPGACIIKLFTAVIDTVVY